MSRPQKKKRRRNRHDPNRARVAAQREEAKRRQREERRKAALAAERKQKRIALLKRWGRFALIGTVVTAVALLIFRPDPEVDGVEIPPEVRALERTPEEASYDTRLPTSGDYLPGDPDCGLFDYEIPTAQAATAVYYGAVVLWYRPDLPEEELQAIVAAASEHDSHWVISPQEGLESPIVATAWNRLMEYDSAEGVDEFLDIYRKRSPGDEDCPAGD
jgi:hypothetical protein